jgi:dimeric dUTPase (all-alpha-NTP-PPase superfamily)
LKPETKIVTGYIKPIRFKDLKLTPEELKGCEQMQVERHPAELLFEEMILQQQRVNDTVATKQKVVWEDKAKSGEWDFLLAGGIEMVELANSREDWWKWWVKQDYEVDYMNVMMELVDAFHFFMSHDIAQGIHPEDLALDYHKNYENSRKPENNKECLHLFKRVASHALSPYTPRFDELAFFGLCKMSGMDVITLHKIYIGKAILNRFRQANGYKEGRYQKIWEDGKEDNFHLMNWLMSYKETVNEENIVTWLDARYKMLMSLPAYNVNVSLYKG